MAGLTAESRRRIVVWFVGPLVVRVAIGVAAPRLFTLAANNWGYIALNRAA